MVLGLSYWIGKVVTSKLGGDFVNKLNYLITPILLISIALLSWFQIWIFKPIECWTPATFTAAMEQYTERYCWIQTTYWTPMAEDIPREIYDRRSRQIAYFQWIPTVLLLQAAVFFIPNIIFNCFQSTTNSRNVRNQNTDQKLQQNRRVGMLSKFKGVPNVGIKLLCLVVAITQIMMVNYYFGNGWTKLKFMVGGFEREYSPFLPTVTLCDFEVRVLGNIHRHTVQCVLSINDWYEHIFVFIWIWFLIIIVTTAVNIVYWILLSIVMILVPFRRYRPVPA